MTVQGSPSFCNLQMCFKYVFKYWKYLHTYKKYIKQMICDGTLRNLLGVFQDLGAFSRRVRATGRVPVVSNSRSVDVVRLVKLGL